MAKDTPATQDVEMKDVEKTEVPEETKKDPDLLTLEDIRQHIKHVEKAVSTKEPRFMSRALRAIVTLRKKLNDNVLRKAVIVFLPSATTPAQKNSLLNYLEEPMDAADKSPNFRPRSSKTFVALPETDVYIHLLILIYLLDKQNFRSAVDCANALMTKVSALNRRTLDLLAAKCYYYFFRAYELTKQMDGIRSILHSRLRTCTLRSDYEGQSTLTNLLLRNYLSFNLYDQADKLVSKTTFPPNASNNEWARYLYYLGRIRAIQLDYSEAHRNLLQAMRKAPQHTAVGFKQTVQKLAITVELLLGDIPDKAIFRHSSMRKTLQPYFDLTQAVRTGNLTKFQQTLESNRDKFIAEGTYTLIVRLRHNVIKTGVRMINLSYSRISLADIAEKLELGSPEDAEYIVAKAIRDGVIEATIDHEQGYVQSKEMTDIYATREPMTAFHQRIEFCLNIHNQSVKAMRFPPKSYNKDLESAEERREREQQELENAKEIADDDFDDFP
jgi:26S proteasome regulatory subunit N3